MRKGLVISTMVALLDVEVVRHGHFPQTLLAIAQQRVLVIQ